MSTMVLRVCYPVFVSIVSIVSIVPKPSARLQ
jgi:hypothetical protein